MNESVVYLRDGETGNLVEASLFDQVTSDHLALWDRDWVPELQRFSMKRSADLHGSEKIHHTRI